MDSVVHYLKKLQKAGVPVLWRPYHEMNGDWFWWGGRYGRYGTRALYKQLFDRYVRHHKLNNLIWVWSVDRPHRPEMHFSRYFPGETCLDVVALDVYGSDFNPTYYDSLMVLADGKPFVPGEVGNPPKPEILDKQPNWTLYVIWAGMVRNTLKKDYQMRMSDKRILSRKDPAYHPILLPYRAACRLPQLPLESKDNQADFSGIWKFNEEESVPDPWGVSHLPYMLRITQTAGEMRLENPLLSNGETTD